MLLFYLGKSFAPTPPLPDYSKFRLDILQFAYRLRWAWYWFKNPPPSKQASPRQLAIQSMELSLVKKEETKQIRTSNNHCLELYIENVTKDLLQTNTNARSKLPDNIPKESREALEAMKKWKEIVIRPADKGSKYFFLDRADYIARVHDHVYDKETFEQVDKDQAEQHAKLAMIDWISKYSQEDGLTEKMYQWITPDDTCKPGNNYVNAEQ